jgi:hypothetical protein
MIATRVERRQYAPTAEVWRIATMDIKSTLSVYNQSDIAATKASSIPVERLAKRDAIKIKRSLY